jgi:O-antigen ligase
MPAQLKSGQLFYGIIVLITVTPLLFFPSLINLYRLPKTALISSLVTLLAWLWLFLLIQENEEKARLPLAIPWVIYFVASLLSLIMAPNRFEGILTISEEITYVLLFWIVVNHIRTEQQVENILIWTIPSAVIVSLIGIYQMFGGNISSLVNIMSPGSTFGNKNSAAQYILLALPFPYMFLLSSTDRQKKRLFAISAAIATTYLIYTGTRAAWIGLLAASVTLLVLLQIKKPLLQSQIAILKTRIQGKKIILGGILLFVLLMNLIPPYFIEDFGRGTPTFAQRLGTAFDLDQDPSFQVRLGLWANTLEMFKDHPLLGIGKGNFKIIYPLYATKARKDPQFGAVLQPREAHNDYLQLFGEVGILGSISFLWIFVLIGRRVWRSIDERKEPHDLLLILALSLSVIALLVEAFLDFPFELPTSKAFFWLLAGLLWVSCEEKTVIPEQHPSSIDKARPDRLSASARPMTVLVAFLASLSILITAVNFTFVRAEFHFSRGVSMAEQKRPELAMQEIKEAEFLNPTTHRYPFVRGLLSIQLEDYPEAILANLRTLALHPYYINGYTNLGVAYASVGKIREAEEAWQKALEIWPDHNDARNNLATVYAVSGKQTEAIAQFRESLRRDPGDKEARQKLKTLLNQTTQLSPP